MAPGLPDPTRPLATGMTDAGSPHHVPVRTILATIGLVLATFVLILIVRALSRVLALVCVAAFFAIVLGPAVDFLERRHIRRGLATGVVFLTGLTLFGAMMYAFVRPIVDQVHQFVEDLPAFVEDARKGRGAVGGLVQRYDIDTYIEENQERLQQALSRAGAPALDVARTVASGLFALVTILVLAFLMLLRGPRILAAALAAIQPARRREHVARVAADCSKAITGYMAGNLLISLIAGVTTFLWLLAWGVPFSGVLGLWVAFADLIPLVGATLGAIPTVAVAFLHSTPAGIATLVFYIAYQQFENHILQVSIMSRTVDLNPLAVLISVLFGVELFGILGALLAIPVAGVIQVVVRDLWDEREARLKPEPSLGASETPLSSIGGGDHERGMA